MNSPTTRQTLLLRIREPDDSPAWVEFVDLYSPLLRKFALIRGVVPQDVDDVVQEVLKAVVQAIKKFDYEPEKGSFRDWLFVVTRSKVARHFKKQTGSPVATGSETTHRMLEQHPAPDSQVVWDLEYRRRMFAWASQQVKGQVSPKTWRAFWMTTVEDLSSEEVARELQMTIGAVYVAKSRVIARMREKIQSVAGELPDFSPPNLEGHE